MNMTQPHELKNWLKVEVAILIAIATAIVLTIVVLMLVGWPSELPEGFYNRLKIEQLTELKSQLLRERLHAVTAIATVWGVIAILFNVYYTAKRAEAQDKIASAQLENIKLARENARAKEKELELARDNARVTEQAQITNRFLAAIEKLGSAHIPVRLGAIYALERIAKNSQTDHSTIVEVLTAFVRENAPVNPLGENKKIQDVKLSATFDIEQQKTENSELAQKLSADIQAALTVLGRRDATQDTINYRLDLSNADIPGASLNLANLSGTLLKGANLQSADFLQANLQGAFLSLANLHGAFLMGANLQGTVFRGANLQGAFLVGANLLGADLSGANLQGAFLMGANLLGANLKGANLLGADLSEAENLASGQIESAKVDSTTVLPHNVMV